MISADLGKPLACGRTADIYAWEDGCVLKLFHNWFDIENIRFEQRMARQVHAAGLPVPVVGELLKANGRNGLVYERVVGQNMWDILEKRPWLVFSLARKTAELHAWVHATNIKSDFPPQRRRLENKLRSADSLPDRLKKESLTALSSLPDGNSICHGDFHPGNILLSLDRAVVIDWIDASRGNPLADFARSSIIILGTAGSSQIPNYPLKLFVRMFHSIYLRTYFQLRPGGEAEYLHWLPVVAAARLSENIPELESWLLKQAESRL
jgi:tRNA A-37 threonylcarbamoyl transferase component Bud32